MKQHFRYTNSSVICCFPYKLYLQISIIMRAPKQPLVFFTGEIQNFTGAPKRSFAFYSEMQNFENCTHPAIRFFTMKHKILKTATKRPFMFLQ